MLALPIMIWTLWRDRAPANVVSDTSCNTLPICLMSQHNNPPFILELDELTDTSIEHWPQRAQEAGHQDHLQIPTCWAGYGNKKSVKRYSWM